jgi:hypothetical protein
MKNRKDDCAIEEILIHAPDEFCEQELKEVFEDTEVYEKLKVHDTQLLHLMKAYRGDNDPEFRQSVLEEINKHHAWKEVLRKETEERSVGRLHYILKNREDDYFFLRLMKQWWGIREPVSAVTYPAYTPQMADMIATIERVCKLPVADVLKWRRRISCKVNGFVKDVDHIEMCITFSAKYKRMSRKESKHLSKDQRDSNYIYTATIGVEQLFELMKVFTEGEWYMSWVFRRQKKNEYNNDDYHYEYFGGFNDEEEFNDVDEDDDDIDDDEE